MQSHHHGLQREACWVLSNIAGTPGRGGLEALKAAGAMPVSCSTGGKGRCALLCACLPPTYATPLP